VSVATLGAAVPGSDHCTVGDCGEPATTWIASRVGEAFCPSHSPTRADQTTTWATCAYCAFQYRSGEASRYIFHLEGHVRTVKEELFIVDRKARAMAQRQIELAESLRAIAAQLPTDGIA